MSDTAATSIASAIKVPPATPILGEFTAAVAAVRTPAEVLDALDTFATRFLPLNVLGAARFPLQASDWRSTRLGRDAFLHDSARPDGGTSTRR